MVTRPKMQRRLRPLSYYDHCAGQSCYECALAISGAPKLGLGHIRSEALCVHRVCEAVAARVVFPAQIR